MPGTRAVLIDVYDTSLTCDFGAHEVELPRLAGVPAPLWQQRSGELGQSIMDGRLTLTDAFSDVISSAGGSAKSQLLDELVRLDQELLVRGTSLYADTVPFLRGLRERGIKSALVSNCAENTRALIDHFGLTPLVDAVVLSCEVGASKPAPAIFRAALGQLDVEAQAALLIDDQQRYCDGAAALGIPAVRIDRGAEVAEVGAVTTFREVEQLLA